MFPKAEYLYRIQLDYSGNRMAVERIYRPEQVIDFWGYGTYIYLSPHWEQVDRTIERWQIHTDYSREFLNNECAKRFPESYRKEYIHQKRIPDCLLTKRFDEDQLCSM